MLDRMKKLRRRADLNSEIMENRKKGRFGDEIKEGRFNSRSRGNVIQDRGEM